MAKGIEFLKCEMKDSEFIAKSLKVIHEEIEVFECGTISKIKLKLKSRGKIRNSFGDFWLFVFEIEDVWKDYFVLVKANINNNLLPEFTSEDLILRIDSACLSGNLFFDYSCDCKLQLEKALDVISKSKEGLIIYIPNQDGRGFGIEIKMPTLSLIYDKNYNTIEAFKKVLNCNVTDKRTYLGVIAILKFFHISTSTRIKLLTGSTNKSNILNENGYCHIESIDISESNNDIICRNIKSKKEEIIRLQNEKTDTI